MQSSPTNTVPRQRSQLYKKIKGGGSVPELKNSLFIWMPSGTSGESVIRDRSSLTLARESVINSVTFTTQRETRYTPRIYRYHTAYPLCYASNTTHVIFNFPPIPILSTPHDRCV